MNLSTKLTVLAAAAVGATALSGVAVADYQTAAEVEAVPEPVSISLRVPKGANGTAIALDGGRQVQVWNFSDGTLWIHSPWVDVRKCIVAPAVGSGRPIAISHEDAGYRDWTLLYVWTANGSSRAAATVDVDMTCPASAVTTTEQSTAGRVTPPKLPGR